MDLLTALQNYLSLYDGGFANRHALRYLYKRDPELWTRLVEATSFLPDDAMPKQRAWHILNDVTERPCCPVTGEYVKWNENQYLIYSSHVAKCLDPMQTMKRMETYKQRTGYDHWNSVDNTDGYTKFRNSYKDTQTRGLHQENNGGFRHKETKDKIKQTWIEKYGVDNPWKCPEIIQKCLDTKIEMGLINPNPTEREKYYQQVYEYTKQSWIEHFDRINPDRVERGKDWHLDHIYSIFAGYRDDVPPEIIGHWTNLRMLSWSDNSSKSSECHKTIAQLYDDYEQNKYTVPQRTRKPPKISPVVEWSVVEPLYRSGEIALKDLSKQFGITTNYLNKMAKEFGWGEWVRKKRGWSEESKERVREAMRNRVISDETRQRIQEAAQRRGDQMRGKTYEELYGTEHAAERRQKMSDGNRGKVRTDEHRAKYRAAAAKRHHKD